MSGELLSQINAYRYRYGKTLPHGANGVIISNIDIEYRYIGTSVTGYGTLHCDSLRAISNFRLLSHLPEPLQLSV
jgi:hypothetical protein